MMKIAFTVLLIASTAYAVNVGIEIPLCPGSMQVQKSSRFVRITAQASPLKGTKIDFYSYKPGSQSSQDPTLALFLSDRFVTNDKGNITIPELLPGRYCVIAYAVNNQFAQLSINVASGRNARITPFTMHLIAEPGPVVSIPYPHQWTSANEQMPVKKRVSVFRGTITDQSGAVLRGLIDIVKKGTEGKEHVAQLRVGSDGQFSVELSSGFYIGFFYADGFKDEVVPFEITKEGTGNIDVTLGISGLPTTRLNLPTNLPTNLLRAALLRSNCELKNA